VGSPRDSHWRPRPSSRPFSDGPGYSSDRGWQYDGDDGVDSATAVVKAINLTFEPIAHFTTSGKFKSGFEFTGAYPGNKGNDYLNLGNILNPGTKDWTVMLWFKRAGGAGDQMLFAKEVQNKWETSLYKAKVSDSGKVQFSFRPDYQGSFYGDNFTCAVGEWCHLTITYDHINQKMYKNGQLVWSYQTGNKITEASPAFGADGTLYFTSMDGYLYAIGEF